MIPGAIEPEEDTGDVKPALASGSRREGDSDNREEPKKKKRKSSKVSTKGASKSISSEDVANEETEVIDLTGL